MGVGMREEGERELWAAASAHGHVGTYYPGEQLYILDVANRRKGLQSV